MGAPFDTREGVATLPTNTNCQTEALRTFFTMTYKVFILIYRKVTGLVKYNNPSFVL